MSSQKLLSTLCSQNSLKTKRPKSEKRKALQNAHEAGTELNLKTDIDFNQITTKDPRLSELLESWARVQSNEQLAKREVSLYIHFQMKAEGLTFENNLKEVKERFKAKYEDTLVLYYGKVKYPLDRTFEFYFNPSKKGNLLQQIRREILNTVWELRNHAIQILEENQSEPAINVEDSQIEEKVGSEGFQKEEEDVEEEELNLGQRSPPRTEAKLYTISTHSKLLTLMIIYRNCCRK